MKEPPFINRQEKGENALEIKNRREQSDSRCFGKWKKDIKTSYSLFL